MDKLLKRLIGGFGVSGHEDEIRKVICEKDIEAVYNLLKEVLK